MGQEDQKPSRSISRSSSRSTSTSQFPSRDWFAERYRAANDILSAIHQRFFHDMLERAYGESSIKLRGHGLTRQDFLLGMFGLAFLTTAGFTGYWQIVRASELAARAKRERTQNVILKYRRGAIRDRNGTVLAQSVNKVKIRTDPTRVAEGRNTAQEIATALQRNLGGQESEYIEMLTRGGTRDVVIAENADPDLVAPVKEMGLDGLYFEDVYLRTYPKGTIAGNLVGCMHDDGTPASGLELHYDDVLSGVNGSRTREREIHGGTIVGGQDDYVPAVDGKDIMLSIDVDIQRVAQEQLLGLVQEWKSGDGCAIVMDPENGEVLACASTPVFDPGDLANLMSMEPLALRPVTDAYEPGSTVKPLTAAMAIDLGIAKPGTKYYVPSEIEVGDDLVGDADERDYDMEMTLTNILERSSNVGMVVCAEEIGATEFSEYMTKFQIGHSTGIDFPYENVPHVSTLGEYTGAWKAMAFGQSLLVSPMQVARAIGALANDGVLMHPHFLVASGDEEVEYGEGSRVVSSATASTVASMMRSVVDNGYGYTGAVEGYHVSAKTGTSQRYDATTGTYSTSTVITSFIGFAPTEDPKVLVYLLIDDVPGKFSGMSMGNAWATIMKEALTKMNVPASG